MLEYFRHTAGGKFILILWWTYVADGPQGEISANSFILMLTSVLFFRWSRCKCFPNPIIHTWRMPGQFNPGGNSSLSCYAWLIIHLFPDHCLKLLTSTISHFSPPSAASCHDETNYPIWDLCQLLEGMAVSGASIIIITLPTCSCSR
jgi:hypothetical protein